MPTPTLADDVREKRDPARAKLRQLAGVIEQIDGTNKVLDKLMAKRLKLWRAGVEMGVSYADLARVSGVSDVTIHQAVNGRKPPKS